MAKTKEKKKKLNVGPRFPLKLIGESGNAFMILGLFQRGAKRAGWTTEQIENARNEMTSGDYNNLLSNVMEFADVE
jgi:hypothetical protein